MRAAIVLMLLVMALAVNASQSWGSKKKSSKQGSRDRLTDAGQCGAECMCGDEGIGNYFPSGKGQTSSDATRDGSCLGFDSVRNNPNTVLNGLKLNNQTRVNSGGYCKKDWTGWASMTSKVKVQFASVEPTQAHHRMVIKMTGEKEVQEKCYLADLFGDPEARNVWTQEVEKECTKVESWMKQKRMKWGSQTGEPRRATVNQVCNAIEDATKQWAKKPYSLLFHNCQHFNGMLKKNLLKLRKCSWWGWGHRIG